MIHIGLPGTAFDADSAGFAPPSGLPPLGPSLSTAPASLLDNLDLAGFGWLSTIAHPSLFELPSLLEDLFLLESPVDSM